MLKEAWQWFDADRWVAVLGLVATLGGLGFAFWQLRRTLRASIAARNAADATRRLIRDSELQQLLRGTASVGRKLDQALNNKAMQISVLHDWLDSYVGLGPAIDNSESIPVAQRDRFLERLEEVKGQVLLTLDDLDRPGRVSPETRGAVRRSLSSLADRATELAFAIDTTEVALVGT